MEKRAPLSVKNTYIQRYAWPTTYLKEQDSLKDTHFIVVIPAFRESEILRTLQSLNDCIPPGKEALVLVVINEPENCTPDILKINQQCKEEVDHFRSWFHLRSIHVTLPEKKAGVGTARKIGMDEAVRVFSHHQRDGIIICLDADCTCSDNYLQAIESYYSHPVHQTGLVYYEHPIHGENAAAMIRYELFLRYYVDALRLTGCPHAFQTVGSCMTVRSAAYQKQGGMNTRQAGEDFYFIHKMMRFGGVGEINKATVYPSDRISDRVPFGTGHALNKHQSGEPLDTLYAPATFEELRMAFGQVSAVFAGAYDFRANTSSALREFYQHSNFYADLEEMRRQSTTLDAFRKRYFGWWDGFRTLKFIHFARDHFYPNIPLAEAAHWLISSFGGYGVPLSDPAAQLNFLRSKDRKTNFYIR